MKVANTLSWVLLFCAQRSIPITEDIKKKKKKKKKLDARMCIKSIE